MGYGSYTSSDWTRITKTRNITKDSQLKDLYVASNINAKLDPRNFIERESCDSPDNPNSTPIIFALDVTGSMGDLATTIAKEALNKTMTELYNKQPVSNPHIMFQAIGDARSDISPLQVTQFEADIRIVEQLLDVWFEGHGGGNGGESYNLAWYFAAMRTKTDSYNKRGEKGFLFTIGDERTHNGLSEKELNRIFGDKLSQEERNIKKRNFTSEELYRMASEKYEVFHITLRTGSCASQHSVEFWNGLIGNHAVNIMPSQLSILPQIFVSIMQFMKGVDEKTIIDQWDQDAAIVVSEILNQIGNDNNSEEPIKF